VADFKVEALKYLQSTKVQMPDGGLLPNPAANLPVLASKELIDVHIQHCFAFPLPTSPALSLGKVPFNKFDFVALRSNLLMIFSGKYTSTLPTGAGGAAESASPVVISVPYDYSRFCAYLASSYFPCITVLYK